MTIRNDECVRVRLVRPDGQLEKFLRRKSLVGSTVGEALTVLNGEYSWRFQQPITVNGDKVRKDSARILLAGDLLQAEP